MGALKHIFLLTFAFQFDAPLSNYVIYRLGDEFDFVRA